MNAEEFGLLRHNYDTALPNASSDRRRIKHSDLKYLYTFQRGFQRKARILTFYLLSDGAKIPGASQILGKTGVRSAPDVSGQASHRANATADHQTCAPIGPDQGRGNTTIKAAAPAPQKPPAPSEVCHTPRRPAGHVRVLRSGFFGAGADPQPARRDTSRGHSGVGRPSAAAMRRAPAGLVRSCRRTSDRHRKRAGADPHQVPVRVRPAQPSAFA